MEGDKAEDYLALPLEERLVHKVWRARLEAYEQLAKDFDQSRSESDPVFGIYNNLDLVKKTLVDSNVVAQEAAYQAFVNYLRLGASPATVNHLKQGGVVKAVCEKGLLLNRKGTKENAIELVMLMVEILDDLVVEEITPHLLARLPKLVAGCVVALTLLVEGFGMSVISPKQLIPVLPKLFAHADKTVRAEATKLTVAMYAWMGEGLERVLFDELKPVQQKDLAKAFELVQGRPEQQRFTRKQQQELQKLQDAQLGTGEDTGGEDPDIEMEPAEFDPYEHMEPVDVLSKIPASFEDALGLPKWKERKEALEGVHATLEKAVKMKQGDYTPLLRSLARCMKDANIQVVQLAANCIECIVKGLQKNFNGTNIVLAPMIDRTKEKKPLVAQALANALDAVFTVTLLSTVLEEALAGTKNKTPAVKIALIDFLQRCLAATPVAPSRTEIDTIMTQGVKLLSELLEPVRQAATQMIGTLMKITGERELNAFLEGVDDNRKAKVKKFFETVEVNAKCKAAAAAPAPNSRAPPSATRPAAPLARAQPPRASSAASNAPSSRVLNLPAKRSATSPAKRLNDTTKLNRSLLTSRSLLAPAPPSPDVPSHDLEELERLRRENDSLRSQLNDRDTTIRQLRDEHHRLNDEIDQWRIKVEEVKRDFTNATLTAKQKETQLLRVHNDLENAKYQVTDLQQQLQMAQLKYDNRALPPNEPRPRVTLGDLSNRVNRLSIDSMGTPDSNRNSQYAPNFRSSVELDSNDDLWKRAAEVTSQLKARIEKMKARSRTNNNYV